MPNEVDVVVRTKDESADGLKSATSNVRQFGDTAESAGKRAAEGQEAFSEKTDRAATTASTATGAFGAMQSGLDLVNLRSTERAQKLDVENQKASTQISNLQAQKAALQADGAARGLSKAQIAEQSKAIDGQVAALQGSTLARNNDIEKINEQQQKTQGLATAFMAFQLTADAVSGVMDLLTLAQNANTLSLIKNRVATIAQSVAQKAAAVATAAWEGAQWLLNAALDANPIGLTIIAIAALVAGIVLAYRHSQTFRDIVQAAFKGIEAAGKALWSGLKAAFNGIVAAAKFVGGAIVGPFQGAFNAIRSLWNSTIGGRGLSIPGWVPGVGGKSFTIPYMAHGGIGSGLSLVGENGPELVDTTGGRVHSAADTARMLGAGGGVSMTVVQLVVDGKVLAQTVVEPLRHSIRTLGSGSVQQYLGRPGVA